MSYFANNIQILRKSKGLNQGEISDRLDLKRNTWSNYENGVSEPGIDKLIDIAQFFDIPIDRMLREDLTQDAHLLTEAGKVKMTLKSTPNSTHNAKNGPEKPSEEGGNFPDIMRMLVESKQEVIKSQQITIDTLNNLLEVRNQEIEKITEENTRLKRAVPEVGRDVEGHSGEGSKKNIA